MASLHFPVLEPNLQVSFYYKLRTIRRLHLREALGGTVKRLDVRCIDAALSRYVGADAIAHVAQFGIRGEVVFAVPMVLAANPFLLGYYRLLLGFSQKEFYQKGPFGRFKGLEEQGHIPDRLADDLEALCRSLIGSAETLVDGLERISTDIVCQLQLLTLGAQFRGSENNRIGQQAATDVRALIESIAGSYVRQTTRRTIVLQNESNRRVLIEFSADPDVCVTEQLATDVRPTLSIEIKGGADASNIHNRLGEAEKSHLKARSRGFREFWTIIGVDLDDDAARRASPTTGLFFNLARILDSTTSDYARFRDRICALMGVQSST